MSAHSHSTGQSNQQPPNRRGQQATDPSNFPAQQRHHSFDSSSHQQLLLQAYIHALQTGQIPMPSIAPQQSAVKAQHYPNHNRTISDAKRGVTFAGQDKLKKLPIPALEE